MKEKKSTMEEIRIDKIILSAGATGDGLVKSKKLLEMLTDGRKAQIIKSNKRIPDFGVRPGLEVGTRITLRGVTAFETLKRMLAAIENTLSSDNIEENHFSFGIKEYIEIPGAEYKREIGIRGLNITVVFSRKGLRTKNKKIKKGRIPKKQHVSKQEIIKFMEEKFNTQIN